MYMEEEVREGISWLDAKLPGWEKLIDLEKLDMSRPDLCVAGQLDTHRIRDVLLEEFLTEFPEQLGFDRYEGVETYRQLTETWKTLLAERLPAT